MSRPTAILAYSPVTTAEHALIAHDEAPTSQKWLVTIRFAPGCDTTALLKVMSILHMRHTQLSHLEFTQAPGGGAVLAVECSTAAASIETVRKSLEKAVQVVSATVREPPSQNGHLPRDTPGGSWAK